MGEKRPPALALIGSKRAHILVVEDEAVYQRTLYILMSEEGYQVTTAGSFEEARRVLGGQCVHLVLVDLFLPDKSGMDLLSFIRSQYPYTEVVVLTGHGSIESAVEATKRGAFAYLVKPFEKETLGLSVRNALETVRLKLENDQLKESLRNEYKFENMVGASSAMQNVFRTIEKISSIDSTILITGESGTGKELIAKAIHFSSPRARHHMVTVNCGAIPEELLESELFGHVKGAFTGATSNRMGRFEAAHRGTLFLDEIGDMPLNLQVKLLRVLQETSFQAVGSNETIEVNVRIIAATNQDLNDLIQKKLFREDLFYRLNVININIPSLRTRREDIPMLIKFFMGKHCKEHQRSILDIDDYALQVLMDYEWPGNVRELENLIEQLVVFKEGQKICMEDLPSRFWPKKSALAGTPDMSGDSKTALSLAPNNPHPPYMRLPDAGLDFNEVVARFEEGLILQALERTQWNKNQAAKLLALNRTTLVEKLKKKNMLRPEVEEKAQSPLPPDKPLDI